MRRANTGTIITALRILADELDDEMITEDGVASAAIREAAARLDELQGEIKKPCVWTRGEGYADTYSAACGYSISYGDGGPRKNGTNYCPRCGGRVKVNRK
jgi:hypothetical protein